jgi:hypothetical protein
LRNNKITALAKSTYILPSLAGRLNSENVNQEIEKNAENINAEIIREESITESVEDSTTNPTKEEFSFLDTLSKTKAYIVEYKIDSEDGRLASCILPLNEFKKEKYGVGTISNFLFAYDEAKHKSDIEKFIMNKLNEQEINSNNSNSPFKTKIKTNDTSTESRDYWELQYWSYLDKTGKTFYSDSSQGKIPEHLNENEAIFFSANGLSGTRTIGYVSMEQNNLSSNNDVPKQEQKQVEWTQLGKGSNENTIENIIDINNLPTIFNSNPATPPKEQVKQNISDLKYLLNDYLNRNNIVLNNKEGFTITMQENGTITLDENNISDLSKVEAIKNLIETDETFQQEIIKIFSNNELFQK